MNTAKLCLVFTWLLEMWSVAAPRWVATTESGELITSTTGRHWTRVALPMERPRFHGVVLSGSTFLAYGSERGMGVLVSSGDNAQTWQIQPLVGGPLLALSPARDCLVGLQENRLLKFSGKNFGFRAGPEHPAPIIDALICCGDTEAGYRCVVVGIQPFRDAVGKQLFLPNWEGITADGSGWQTKVKAGTSLEIFEDKLVYGLGNFWRLSGANDVRPLHLQISHDGETWRDIDSPSKSNAGVEQLLWTGTKLVAVDSGLSDSVEEGLQVFETSDAANWQRWPIRAPAPLAWIRSTAALTKGFYVSGLAWTNAPKFSPDLQKWLPMEAPAPWPPEWGLRSVAYRPE